MGIRVEGISRNVSPPLSILFLPHSRGFSSYETVKKDQEHKHGLSQELFWTKNIRSYFFQSLFSKAALFRPKKEENHGKCQTCDLPLPPSRGKRAFPFSFCLLHSFLLWRTCGFVLTGRDRLTMETEKKLGEGGGGESGKQEQEAPARPQKWLNGNLHACCFRESVFLAGMCFFHQEKDQLQSPLHFRSPALHCTKTSAFRKQKWERGASPPWAQKGKPLCSFPMTRALFPQIETRSSHF